jgi:hypothetical protein
LAHFLRWPVLAEAAKLKKETNLPIGLLDVIGTGRLVHAEEGYPPRIPRSASVPAACAADGGLRWLPTVEIEVLFHIHD